MNIRKELSEFHYDRTHAEIYLDRARRNVSRAKAILPEGERFCVVLKTDAYGHGAPAIASAVYDIVDEFAVASVQEGIILRKQGIEKPILNLGVVPVSDYEIMLENKIMPSVFTLEQAKGISAACENMGVDCEINIAVDTGMGRIGILTEDSDCVETALAIAAVPHIKVQGMYTHFASADETDHSFAMIQLERYRKFADALESAGLHIPVRHCSNSAGIVEGIGTDFDMVRDGICVYGIYPSNEVSKEKLELEPVLEWKSEITHVKWIPQGYPVSYGSTFVAPERMQIATIPTGYGEGYPRALSGKGSVLIHGQECKILGRICMDQFMVDVTGLDANVGDMVTLIGRDGDREISLYDFEKFGCFTYEFLCNIGKRVPRVYIMDEKVVGHHDAFSEEYKDFKKF